MLRTGSLRFGIAVVALFCLMGRATPAHGEDTEASFEVVDPDAIYYGSGTHPKGPGVLVADDVWKEIPEYKRILDED
jgi:hypothetical protein